MNLEIDSPRRYRYDEIEGEAWEHYLLELLRAWAAEARRIGAPCRPIDEVRLVGDSYPHWGFEIYSTDPQDKKKVISRFPIDDWRSRASVRQAFSDILVEVEGS
jgi:hypothetical protein